MMHVLNRATKAGHIGARPKKNRAVIHRNRRTDWETPPELFRELDREFGFTLDAAAADHNALCPTYYTSERSGLEHPWHASTYCNPPYTARDIWLFCAKAYSERYRGNTTVMLLPANTDAQWFHDWVWSADKGWIADELRFIRGRVQFLLNGERPRNAEGKLLGNSGANIIVIYRGQMALCESTISTAAVAAQVAA